MEDALLLRQKCRQVIDAAMGDPTASWQDFVLRTIPPGYGEHLIGHIEASFRKFTTIEDFAQVDDAYKEMVVDKLVTMFTAEECDRIVAWYADPVWQLIDKVDDVMRDVSSQPIVATMLEMHGKRVIDKVADKIFASVVDQVRGKV